MIAGDWGLRDDVRRSGCALWLGLPRLRHSDHGQPHLKERRPLRRVRYHALPILFELSLLFSVALTLALLSLNLTLSGLTDEERAAILKLGRDPKIGDRIVASIAPSIYGQAYTSIFSYFNLFFSFLK